jgi:CMP-N-acetylneuraminic acid synthetase
LVAFESLFRQIQQSLLTLLSLVHIIAAWRSNSLFLPLSKNRVRSQDKKPFLLENGLIYFISKKFFIKNKRIFINNKCNIFVTEKYESIDINNKKDYIISKKLYK